MRAVIEDIQDSFEIGYKLYKESREESDEIWALYHNRHFTSSQLAKLSDRGQPAETFNIVKMFSRMLVGYYSTVVNTAVANPTDYRYVTQASIITDIIDHTFRHNRIHKVEGDKIKLGGLISGLLVSYIDVVETGRRDEFGRPINQIKINHVPDSEIVLDPASREDDYSDATYLHRYKWLTEETCRQMFGAEAISKLAEYYNHLNASEADFEYFNKERFVGKYKVQDNYLVVHTVMTDESGDRWSIYWCEDTILKKTKVSYKEVKWPYRVQKLHSSDTVEHYGLFREVAASQHAINQAVIKIQLMVNSSKVLVQEDAVEDLSEFESAYNRVSGVIPVLNLGGVRVEQLTRDIVDQYTIIDKALERIQKVLGINDSFLGMAFASDSGRKVKLQQNATIMSLRYVTARIESFYELIATDTAKLAQQYYTSHQIVRIADEVTGNRYIELNAPITEWTGKMLPDGQPEMRPVLLPETNPANPDEFVEDGEGNIVFGPVTTEESDFSTTDFEIDVEANAYNDEDEKAQLMLETFMSGAIGQAMMSVNPAGFFKMAALNMKSLKTKYSPDVVEVLEQTANALSQNPEENSRVANANLGAQSGFGSQPKSETLKLPVNTQGEF